MQTNFLFDYEFAFPRLNGLAHVTSNGSGVGNGVQPHAKNRPTTSRIVPVLNEVIRRGKKNANHLLIEDEECPNEDESIQDEANDVSAEDRSQDYLASHQRNDPLAERNKLSKIVRILNSRLSRVLIEQAKPPPTDQRSSAKQVSSSILSYQFNRLNLNENRIQPMSPRHVVQAPNNAQQVKLPPSPPLIQFQHGHSHQDADQSGALPIERIEAQPRECHYCKLADSRFVVKCCDCDLYFCNGTGLLNTSHIFHHLVSSHHTTIEIDIRHNVANKDSCNVCGGSNVFKLGFISSKKYRYLMCRAPCQVTVEEMQDDKLVMVDKPVHANFIEYFRALEATFPHLPITREQSLTADSSKRSCREVEKAIINKWTPLIDSYKRLIQMVTRWPSRADEIKCRTISAEGIEKIEVEFKIARLACKVNRFGIQNSDLIDQTLLDVACETSVHLCYENGGEYQQTFYELLKSENCKRMIDGDDNTGNKVVFNRMTNALKVFANNEKKMHSQIYDIILGKARIAYTSSEQNFDVAQYSAPNLAVLNQSQARALHHAIFNPVTLIQGPPGTGKTHLAACLVYNLIMRSSKKIKILVTAPSNIAADHLASKIQQTNLNVFRLLSITKENDKNYHSPLSIHHRLCRPNANNPLEAELADHLRRTRYSWADENKSNRLRKKLFERIFDQTHVVVTTCVASADSRLSGRSFKYVLCDEGAQATEPEVLIPLNQFRSIQKFILIGDIKQLSPVIKNRAVEKAELGQSLFERLVALGNKSFMLNLQYRMHPFISLFPRQKFYDGLLLDGISASDRILSSGIGFRFPIPRKPVFFWACKKQEQIGKSGTSYLNPKEGRMIGRLVYTMVSLGVKESQIGIMTPYEGMLSELRTTLKFFDHCVNYKEIDIASINAYQGREKDIIILSTVRSNEHSGRRAIGFLSDTRRLNVALTRAKYGMVIVGDPTTLRNEPVWNELLKFYQDNNLVFQGRIDRLKPYSFL